MEFNLLTENISTYRKILMILGGFCAALSLCVLLLVGLCFKLKNDHTTVLVPLGLHQAAWVKNGAVSANYLSAIAQNIISLRFNVTPESVDESYKLLLGMSAPATRGQLSSILAKDTQNIKEDRISSVFFISSIQSTVGKHIRADILGRLITYSGAKPVSTEYKHFRLTFVFNGSLLLTGMHEVVKHA